MTKTMTLVQVLRSGRQADPDGVEVRISRQAVEEAATELEQLRGNLSLAEEGLANYALEVERLTKEHKGAWEYVRLASQQRDDARAALQQIINEGDLTAPEGMKRIAQMALSASHEPCEQPLEAETRAATSRKVPSTEDVGRPPPSEEIGSIR